MWWWSGYLIVLYCKSDSTCYLKMTAWALGICDWHFSAFLTVHIYHRDDRKKKKFPAAGLQKCFHATSVTLRTLKSPQTARQSLFKCVSSVVNIVQTLMTVCLSAHRVCPRRSFRCFHGRHRYQRRLRPQRPPEDSDSTRSPQRHGPEGHVVRQELCHRRCHVLLHRVHHRISRSRHPSSLCLHCMMMLLVGWHTDVMYMTKKAS